MHAVYVEAEKVVARQGPPLTGPSIDRRQRECFTSEFSDANLQSLMCLTCSRIEVFDANDTAPKIGLHKLMDEERTQFLDVLDADTTERLFGSATYLEEHGHRRDTTDDTEINRIHCERVAKEIRLQWRGGQI